MFSILANIIIVFGLFGMLVATWMLFKGTKKAIEFVGISHQKNKKIRTKKPNYFVRWWQHLKNLYEEDMRKQRMLKRSLPEVQVTEVTEPVQESTTEVEETPDLTIEVTPVSEATESAAEEVVITTINKIDTEVDLTKVSKITGEMLKYGVDADTVIKSTSEMLKTSPEFFSKKENSEEEAVTEEVIAEATEETVSEVLEPEVLENETKTSKKRGKK